MTPPIPPDLIRDTVRETLLSLGFSTEDPTALQADMHYLRRIRRGSEEMARVVRHSIVTLIVSTGLYLLWLAVKKVLHDT